MPKQPASNLNSKIILAILAVAVIVSVFVLFENRQNDDQNHENSQDQYVKEYSLPDGTRPNAILVDNDGTVWIASSNSGKLLSLDPQNGVITNYSIKENSSQEDLTGNSTATWAMVQDSDGYIWFAELGTKLIWRLDSKNNSFDSIHSETGSPFQMKVGKDHDIWFTTLRGNTVGVISKLINGNYTVSAFDTGNNTSPAGLFLQNNSVWTANVGTQNILQYKIDKENISIKSISKIGQIPKSNTTIFSSPTDLLLNNNSVWLTEHGTSFLTRYDIDTGKITQYPTSQNNFHTVTLPFWIRGAENPKFLWFNEHQGNKIGRFDLTDNSLVEYSIPSVPEGGYITYPLNLSQDPKDEKILWFSEWNTDKVGVIDGNIPIPFKILPSVKKTILSSTAPDYSLDLTIKSNSNHPNTVSLNASSSIASTAELGNLTIKFLPNIVDLSSDQKVQLLVHDGGVVPGNYTLGISISDGYVTKTEFLDLSIIK
ncbi:MAG TPA: two-component regulator propeller domain-containing protein [Candidatus Nitrosotalea sp.]|nr:two-component regulator propeller domain-containing protein [Candidatus Nitrosotalea sp.]